MHETSMIKDIIKQAESKGNVIEVTIEVGELAPIEPDHFKEHIKELVNWKVSVQEKKARVECQCGYIGKPEIMVRGHDFVLWKCPWCGDVPKVVEGDKITIKEVICA